MCSAQPILAVFLCRAGTMPRPGCHRNLSSLSCHSSDWQCKCLQIHLWDTTLLTHEPGHWGDLSHSKLMMALSHHVKGLSKREQLAWGLGLHTSQPGNRNCPESRLCTTLWLSIGGEWKPFNSKDWLGLQQSFLQNGLDGVSTYKVLDIKLGILGHFSVFLNLKKNLKYNFPCRFLGKYHLRTPSFTANEH